MTLLNAIATALTACFICAALIVLLRPLLARYVLARPNARSSHSIPTPQGGGVAVIAAVIISVAISVLFFRMAADSALLTIFAAALLLTLVGAYDDLWTMRIFPRLLLQAMAAGIVVASLPEELHIVKALPLWAERALLLVSLLWFVNLVNFMDGIDWITVAELIPVTAALALFGFYGQMPPGPTLVAIALCGSMIGFAPFNRPVAKLFLGDMGSLPIGLLTGWCLLQLAASGHLAAALLLPLYYLADATITLLRRLIGGEPIWISHRSHFYQRATDSGFGVMRVVGEVFVLNLVLATLAALSVWLASPYTGAMALALGAGCVALVLIRFSRKR